MLQEVTSLDSARKDISNNMMKTANGLMDHNLFLVKVKVPHSQNNIAKKW